MANKVKEIKAIQTKYDGHRFRSRLEAKWATFFNNADIEYEYEPEGYVTSDGDCYLPDFYLPKQDAYFEVKRNTNDIDEDVIKCYKSIEWGGPIKKLIFLTDIPSSNLTDGMWCFPTIYYGANGKKFGWWQFCDSIDDEGSPCLPCDGYILEREYDAPFFTVFIENNKNVLCKRFSDKPLAPRGETLIKENSIYYTHRIEKEKELYKFQERDGYYERMRECDSMVSEFENPYFLKALEVAKQARFEHGEKG